MAQGTWKGDKYEVHVDGEPTGLADKAGGQASALRQ